MPRTAKCSVRKIIDGNRGNEEGLTMHAHAREFRRASLPPVLAALSVNEDEIMALLPNYKEITELIKRGANLEAQEKIIELREGALDLQEENIRLRERVKELESQLQKKSNVVWEKPFYWAMDGEKRDGPFCQKCYDTQEKIVRLQHIEQGHWHCKSCDNRYYEDSYNPSEIGVVPLRSKWDVF